MRCGVALLLSAVLCFAGCSLPVHRQFHTVLLREGGKVDPLPVTLIDATGRLLALDPGDPDMVGWENDAAAVPGAPDAVAVRWIGGACDRGIAMRLEYAPMA